MRILILTDHRRHSEHNSMYALARALSIHPEITSVLVGTRGDERNHAFFMGIGEPEIYVVQCDDKFSFPADNVFSDASFEIKLSDVDVIFLRLPRPVPDAFFTFLETSFDPRKIINRPNGIRKTSSKAYLLNFDKFVAPMKLCRTWDDIISFSSRYDCVLKPLLEYGGRGIIRIQQGTAEIDQEAYTVQDFEQLYKKHPQTYLAMKFLKNVALGDKRIVVVNGHVLTSSLRIPAKDQWLCNVGQGGRDVPTPPDDRELEIVEYIHPYLAKEGIFYYGLDTLVDDDGQRVISEINTLSIGGIAPSELKSGKPLSHLFSNSFVDYVKTKS